MTAMKETTKEQLRKITIFLLLFFSTVGLVGGIGYLFYIKQTPIAIFQLVTIVPFFVAKCTIPWFKKLQQ